MAELNRAEKQIVVAILVSIMEADTIIDPREVDFLDRAIAELGFGEFDLDSVGETDDGMLIDAFKHFSAEKKAIAMKLFRGMAISDGYEDPRELKIIDALVSEDV